MNNYVVALFVLAGLPFTLIGCRDLTPDEWQSRIQHALTSSYVTEHFEVRYRPNSNAAVHARRLGALAESELSRICARFDVANDAHYTLFLFDDGGEVAKLFKHPGISGFSMEHFCCVVFDDDAARFHEMVHAVAYGKIGGAKTSFVLEGLAGALLDSTYGVDMHAVAKYYRRDGKLPRLPSATQSGFGDWMKWLSRIHAVEKDHRLGSDWDG